ncbi:hypothetical protein P7C73_g1522, partial [Tremellales sp. Uapishka_1]
MPPYLYPLPTTSLLTFSHLLHDPSSSYTTDLADATAARTKLHLALKAVSGSEPGSSAVTVLDAVQGYLPYLRGILACLESDQLLAKGDPVFPWRAPLTQTNGSTPLFLPSFHSEHLFVLLTYILALSNYAHSILASLPDLATSNLLSKDDEKRTTAGLSRAVDLLCQGAGIAEWAAENVAPSVEGLRVGSGGRLGRAKWPVESSAETFKGLSMILLADAHVVAIRKLLLPVLPHTLFSPPGPPLPSSHPSPALLAKLYLHIASLYSSARALFKVSSPSSSRKLFSKSDADSSELDAIEGEIIPTLKRYLRKESILASALAYKWLAVDTGENSKGTKIGEAVCLAKEAKGRLEEMEDGKLREKMKGLGMGKGNERRKEERMGRRGRLERELADVNAWSKVYTRMNDTVSFQPVPLIGSIVIPSGRPIFSFKPFVPPPIKFGPRYSETAGADNAQTYAGKGNYF